jgi:Ca2+-binding RTX toxin-like protein
MVDLTRGLVPGTRQAINMEAVTGSPKDDLLRGDARSNILVGGGGFDILVGEDGDDKLMAGNTGRCVLIGGRGQDTLVGGDPSIDPLTLRRFDGGDLLIGGRTTFDGDPLALNAIRNEWRRTDRTYEQRIAALRTGVPVSTGVVAQLTTATVPDDGVVDQLAGKGGDDWFWALRTEVIDRAALLSRAGPLEFIN